MGGLGPGIGGLEYVVIGLVALLVLGPERLPVMLNRLGKLVAKARNMANEFRAGFDEMARQAELDELRKEVEALKRGQNVVPQALVPLGAEAEAAFRDIGDSLKATPSATPAPLPAPAVDEWPDAPPSTPEAVAAPKPELQAKSRSQAKPAVKKTTAPKAEAAQSATRSATRSAAKAPSAASKPGTARRRTKKADQ